MTPDPLHGRSDPASYWSTTNLAEAYPGILTPLGWTVAGPATEAATRAALAAIGALTPAERAIPDAVERRVYTVFFGRIATRMDFFCEVGDRMPGTSGPAVADQIFGFVPPGAAGRPVRRRYPVIAAKLPATFAAAPRRSRRARDDTARWWPEQIRRCRALSLDGARSLFAEALARFTMHLTVDGTALLAGTQPVYDQLWRLAETVGVNAADLVSGYGSHEESELVHDLWACSRDRIDLDTVARRYGYHGPNEGEVSSRVWRVDTGPLQRAVKAYAAMPDSADPVLAAAARARTRERAAADFLAALPTAKRPVGRLLVRLAEVYMPLRGKVGRLQALDVVRAAARRIGACLAANGDLADPEDVFFLTVDELLETPFPARSRDLVGERRARHEHYRTLNLPRSWQGEPTPVATTSAGAGPDGPLRGTGVSPGVVEGRIRVVTDPAADDLEPGDILIAHTTDPSWAALMFLSSALVVEIGGSLSHAAVVARELGVPCVMGLDAATTRLRTGDRCRVDGTTGEVTPL